MKNVLVINSWATWSPFSVNDLTLLAELQKQYGEDITVLAINRKEQKAIVRSYLSTFNLHQEDLVYLMDPTDHFYTASEGYSMPETAIYKKDGTIHAHIRGDLKRGEFEKMLDQLLVE